MESGCDLTGDRITGVVAIGEDDSIVGHGGVSGNGRAGARTRTRTEAPEEETRRVGRARCRCRRRWRVSGRD